ncbi:TonB-dependent receptor [Kolteria novifilia]|uniref:TonB-dependent receptor n=1 Tax=Kolteria novifilia TaxID=2527975 RepID=UPI003AF341E2
MSTSLVEAIAQRSAQAQTATTESNPAAPSSVVSTQASAQPAPASTGDLLERAISISVQRTSPTYVDARVRAFNPRQTVAAVDGMPELKTRIDIDTIMSQIPPGLVDNLTVVDGPYTSLYGPGFAFIVAELTPLQEYLGPTYRGTLSLSQDTNAHTLYQRETAQGGGRDWSFVASYGLRTAADYFSADGFRVPAQYTIWDGFTSVGFRISDTNHVAIQFLHPEQNGVELPGVVYDLVNSTNNQGNIRWTITEGRKGPKRVMVEYWYNRTGYDGNSFRSSKQETFFVPFIREVFGTSALEATGRLTNQGVRMLSYLGDEDEAQLILGVDWSYVENEYTEVDFDANGQLNPIFFGVPKASSNDFGILANATLPITSSTKAIVGGRLDAYLASLDPEGRAEAGELAIFKDLTGTNSAQQFLGMVYTNLEQHYTENLSTKIGGSVAMRAPDTTELYTTDPFVPIYRFGNSVSAGNSFLDPETNLQFDAGLFGNWDRASFGFRMFQSNIFNYILAVPYLRTDGSAAIEGPDPRYTLGRTIQDGVPVSDTGSIAYQYRNAEYVSIYGLDFICDFELKPWMAIDARTSYAKGTNRNPEYLQQQLDGSIAVIGHKGSSEGLPQVYPWNGSIGLRFFEPKCRRWEIRFDSRMVMNQTFVADSFGELPSRGFILFGMKAYWQILRNVRLTLALENLLNRKYSEINSLAIANPVNQMDIFFVPESGFNGLFGLQWQF